MFDVFLFSYLFFPFFGVAVVNWLRRLNAGFLLDQRKKSVKMDEKVCDINGPTGDLDGTKSFARKTERC